MEKIWQIMFFILITSNCYVAKGKDISPIGAEAKALGGCSILVNNVFSIANNQALLPWQKKASLGITFQNYYAVRDLNQLNIAGIVPIKNAGYGFHILSFGNGAYRQQSIGVAAAYSFNSQLSLGLGADYNTIAIKQYGQNSVLTVQGGISAKINSKLQIGFHVYNPLRAKFNDYKDERIASSYKLGLCYTMNTQIKMYAEAEKNSSYKSNLKVGINYSIKDNFNLRCGFASAQPQICFGFGYKFKKTTIEFASVIHQSIGLSSNISLIFQLAK